MMKRIFLLLILLIYVAAGIHAQNIGVNSTGATPDKSAMLDVSSTTKGMLVPRMTSAQRTAITSPAKGLLVFDSDNNSFWFYSGTAWAQLSGIANVWNLSGNSGTNSSTDFLGTTDDKSLHFRIKNINAGILDSNVCNTAFGFRAMDSATTAPNQFNTSFGYKSLSNNTAGVYNTAVGGNSLRNNTTGIENTAVGLGALYTNSTGSFNTANGVSALNSNTSGTENTAVGFYTLNSNTTGIGNTATGSQALNHNTIGSFNTATGHLSLTNNTIGDNNTATGESSLEYNTSGTSNTALGNYSLIDNTTGSYNTATGYLALEYNISGNNNTANGDYSLYFNTSGDNNTAIGYNALENNTVGHNNIAIGYGAGTAPYAADVFNTISIGNDDYLNGYRNQAFIGNTSTAWIGGNVTWMTFSDARIKNTIKEDVKGLDFILKLRPVTYHISNKAISSITANRETPDFPGKYERENIKYTGFLGQEVEQAAISVGYDFSGCVAPKDKRGLYSLSYEQFVVPLVKAVQEQQAIIENQQKEIKLLEKRLNILEGKQ